MNAASIINNMDRTIIKEKDIQKKSTGIEQVLTTTHRRQSIYNGATIQKNKKNFTSL